jgi:hypothetical protein
MLAFRVGQKVVCVNDGPSRFNGQPSNLVRGNVYTIKASWLHWLWGLPVVLLDEIDPPGTNDSFDSTRFRPIVERKTNISIFKKILTPKREKLPA